MRGSKAIEIILDILQSQAEAAIAILDVMTSSRSTGYKKARGYIGKRPDIFPERWSELFRDRQRFHTLLNYLKTQGLVKSERQKRKSFWKITQKGSEKLAVLRERNLYSKETATYPPQNNVSLIIVSYDIPKRENRKRYWLCEALFSLGFRRLQYSLWAGKKKVPEKFVRDLRQRKMLPYIHIFEVTKGGTIKEIS